MIGTLTLAGASLQRKGKERPRKKCAMIRDLKVPKGINLVAFDPGEHTGVVVIKDGELVDHFTVGWEEMLREVAFKQPMITMWAEQGTWVVESFILYPWRAAQMGFDTVMPVQVIGMLRVAMLQSPLQNQLVIQNAGTVKHFATDGKLKQIGWWNQLRSPHEKDAARHALYYLLSIKKESKYER